jgi:hypothetical protein
MEDGFSATPLVNVELLPTRHSVRANLSTSSEHPTLHRDTAGK